MIHFLSHRFFRFFGCLYVFCLFVKLLFREIHGTIVIDVCMKYMFPDHPKRYAECLCCARCGTFLMIFYT